MMRLDDAIVNLQSKSGSDIGVEILAIFLGLESDQIIGQHRLDQLAMMRHAFDHRARGPGRVQEEADRLADAELAQFGAEREEVIILNPERGIGLFKSQKRARHEGVDLAIRRIMVLGNPNQVAARMQRRPQSRIRKALVIAAVVRSRQIEHRERAGAERLDLGEWFLLGTLADAAGGTNPNRAGVFHHRQQRGRQPARHGLVGFAARNAI
jgi:hypothetical protein